MKKVKQIKNDIVCIGFPAWEGDYLKSTVLMMKELSYIHKVLYVEYPFTFKDLLMGIIGRKHVPVTRILGLKSRLRNLSEQSGQKLHVLTLPPIIPVNWLKTLLIYNILMTINALIVRWSVNRSVQKIGLKDVTVVNAFSPSLGLRLEKSFDERKLLYYCYDEISQSPWASKHGGREEKQFLQKVDCVIVSSEGLYSTKSRINKNCYLVKNGVDIDLFTAARKIKIKNSKQDGKRKKVMGFLGTFDNRVDMKLMKMLATDLPEIQIRIVGRVLDTNAKRELEPYNNIVFTGPKSPDQIPLEVAKFDVGIIPFVRNKFTRNIYPMKVNEYLGMGIPVVTTDFAPLNEFQEVINIAKTRDEFIQYIRFAIENNNSNLEMKRIGYASQNTWRSRGLKFSEYI